MTDYSAYGYVRELEARAEKAEAEGERLRAAVLAWLESMSSENLAAMRELAERRTTSPPPAKP